MKKFADTVKAHNESVLSKAETHLNYKSVEADDNLANDFDAKSA